MFCQKSARTVREPALLCSILVWINFGSKAGNSSPGLACPHEKVKEQKHCSDIFRAQRVLVTFCCCVSCINFVTHGNFHVHVTFVFLAFLVWSSEKSPLIVSVHQPKGGDPHTKPMCRCGRSCHRCGGRYFVRRGSFTQGKRLCAD